MKRQTIAYNLLISSALCGAIFTGCSSTPEPSSSDSPAILSGTDEQIFVGDSIEMNYDPNVIMKRAEAYFEKESFLEAIVEYKHFLDLHRNHMLAPYAQYKIAMSHYKRFKTIDRDPEPIQESLAAFRKLVTEFPDSRYEAEAHEKVSSCQEHLALHDLFVGEFYYNRESYLAAAHRFKQIVERYPHLETAGEAKYHLAETYEKLGNVEWAKDWLVDLAQKDTDHPFYDRGMQMLTKLQNDHPNLEIPEMPTEQEQPIRLAKVEPALSPMDILAFPPLEESTSQQPANTLSECSIGSWCESSALTPTPRPITPSPSNASTPATCQAGQWC
ncbi:outer membrane protein assembly factor BamD [Nitrospira sp. M1]